MHTPARKKSNKTRDRKESQIWRARESVGKARDKTAESAGGRINTRSEAACRGMPVTCHASSSERFGCSWKLDMLPIAVSRSLFPFQSHPMSQTLLQQHPLQRLPSPSRGISALVHVCLVTCPVVLAGPAECDPWLTFPVGWPCQLLLVF